MADNESTDARIRTAITDRRLVEVRYQGTARIAEPHDYGLQKGRQRLLVFQRRGPARPGHASTGWRLLDRSKIEALTVLEETFEGSRGPSHSAHYQWDAVYERVK